jgi:hypothetical protein
MLFREKQSQERTKDQIKAPNIIKLPRQSKKDFQQL